MAHSANPTAVSPASGQLNVNVNLHGKAASQMRKQMMLMGNFSPAAMWQHDEGKLLSNQRQARSQSRGKRRNISIGASK